PVAAVPLVLALALAAQAPLARAVSRSSQLSVKRHIVLVESLFGIETVKALGAEPALRRDWEQAVGASADVAGATRFWSTLATTGTQLVMQGVSVCLVLLGVYLIAEGRITVGALIAANILAGRVLAPLGGIAQTLFRLQTARQGYRALSEVMAAPTDGARTGDGLAEVSAGALALRGVSFTYPGAQVPALREVTLELAPGEVVALLGRIGSGKSTLGRLLNGLLVADAGVVLVDGVEVGQYDPAALRAGVGVLPQDPDLFSGTLRDNLAMAAPEADEGGMIRALEEAGLGPFLAAAPEGLGTYVGERGARLSGGQRQAVGLARLILRRPRILFLDEPTNAMDHRTEAAVIARLRDRGDTGATTILCTHRMELAALAARWVVLEGGRVVADGPRDEVMARLAANGAARVAAVP
ncbi:MAG: ATP-binding cassette domain-containing protein, partial [Shimia sp.]